jgi:hypothetical protein
MPDATPLLDAVDRLAGRLRSMSRSRLVGSAPGQPPRAEAALALARRLAAAAHEAEQRACCTPGRDDVLRPAGEGLEGFPGARTAPSGSGPGCGGAARPFPDAGPYAVGDQLAVAGHDLAAALAALPPDTRMRTADGAEASASDVLVDAVAAVRAVAKLT